MKEYLSQCLRIAMAMLISLCFISCGPGIFDDVLEISGDGGRRRYSGDSYEVDFADDSDIGFNVAYRFLYYFATNEYIRGSFFQPSYDYNKYQLAHATGPLTKHALGIGYHNQRPSLSYQASSGEFLDHLAVLTGLEFVQKNSSDEETKIRLSYLQVPVLAIYTYDLSDDRKVFGGLGPYFAYGVGGKIKGPGYSEKAFDKDFGFKRFDAGMSFTAGYKFNKKWSVRLGYDLGLANIEQDSFDKAKNRCLSLSIGYWPQLIQKLVKN